MSNANEYAKSIGVLWPGYEDDPEAGARVLEELQGEVSEVPEVYMLSTYGCSE